MLHQLSDEEILAARRAHESTAAAARSLGVPRETLRDRMAKWTPRVVDTPSASDKQPTPIVRGRVHEQGEKTRPVGPGVRRYVVTSAQNNTPVHPEVWATLTDIARRHDAEILVSRFTYYQGFYRQASEVKGSSSATDEYGGLWYDNAIADYVCDERVALAPSLVFCGELNIMPSESAPLSGFTAYTGVRSTIIPHAQFALQSVATTKGDPAKMMYTTGTVTQRNYIPKKAGHKADWNHGYGGLLVEVDATGEWWVRQLNADNSGHICDVGRRYSPDGSCVFEGVEALTLGDMHAIRQNDDTIRPILDLIQSLRPRYVFLHDVLDFRVRNHHTAKDPLRSFADWACGLRSVNDELRATTDIINRISGAATPGEVVVVSSNHDDAFTRWLREADHRKDPENALLFLEASLAAYRHIQDNQSLSGFSPLAWAHARHHGAPVRFLGSDESFIICPESGGIECGMHGHLGPNGSRGSPQAFARIGRKSNTGHTHTAAIVQGACVAGVTGNLDHGYNIGPSSWSNSHIATNKNGKRQILTERNGLWRAA